MSDPRAGRERISRRSVLGAGAAGFAGLAGAATRAEAAEEQLYNGIVLPSPWPPRGRVLGLEPAACPYLEAPPAVIPIDVGRQLFVDDFLIERSTLRRVYHPARWHPESPVVRPDRPWEQAGEPTAMAFSDGAWFDPRDRLFKLWYMGGYARSTCMATSRDGLRWEKPDLGVVPGTNVVHAAGRDSATVWLDPGEAEPARRFKLFRAHNGPPGFGSTNVDDWALSIHFSPDGIRWSEPAHRSGLCGDRTTVFHNPFRAVWVYSIRDSHPDLGRVRTYREGPDVLDASRWRRGDPVPWAAADRLDPRRADLDVRPQLYNLDAAPYESLLLGFFTIWRGQPRDRAKPNEVCLGFSRDGFHWHRPSRQAFLPVSERHGDWNWGNVQSAGGGCLVVGEQLYFYASGRAGVRGSAASGVSGTGLALLRRDGFASLEAGEEPGSVTTRPLRFSGRRLFVNVDAPRGELWAEMLDAAGRVMDPFSRENCRPVRADGTAHAVEWKGAPDLARAAGRAARFRFHLRQGKLYAFWVSPDASGASRGFLAAGGPGFPGHRDGG